MHVYEYDPNSLVIYFIIIIMRTEQSIEMRRAPMPSTNRGEIVLLVKQITDWCECAQIQLIQVIKLFNSATTCQRQRNCSSDFHCLQFPRSPTTTQYLQSHSHTHITHKEWDCWWNCLHKTHPQSTIHISKQNRLWVDHSQIYHLAKWYVPRVFRLALKPKIYKLKLSRLFYCYVK